jgi:hypothetical protein
MSSTSVSSKEVRVDRDECSDCGAEPKSLMVNYGMREHRGFLCDCTLEIASHDAPSDCPICELLEEMPREGVKFVHSHRDARNVVWTSD